MPRLIFYTTAGCHLCEHAAEMLQHLQKLGKLSYESVDIASDEGLVELYGIRIPVVRNPQSNEEIGWPFGEAELLSLT